MKPIKILKKPKTPRTYEIKYEDSCDKLTAFTDEFDFAKKTR
jgi:hypothetical protein